MTRERQGTFLRGDPAEALLVLALSIKRARRSPKLRPPRRYRYRDQDLPL